MSNVISSSSYNFGSLESIRRQAKEIGDRVRRESDSRRKKQEETGLIENKDGKMVEISSLTQEQVDRLNDWHDVRLFSPQEAMIGFMAADPNAEEVEESKRRGAKCAKIQDKMMAGQKLTSAEKSFLKENYPEMAAKAEQMEQLTEQVSKRLRGSKSKEESQQIYLQEKLNVLSQLDPKDGSALFLMAAIDNAYNEHTGRKNPSLLNIDIKA